MTVALGIPMYGSIHTLQVTHLLNHLAWGIAQRIYSELLLVEGAYVDTARNMIVRNALECAEQDEGVTHLFFHDQDVIVGEDILPALVELDLPVVGAAYFGRDPQHRPIAFDLDPFVRVDLDLEGLNKVGGVGMGATLIHLDVFRGMRERFGDEWWFRCTEEPGGDGRRTGEDVWFCRRLQAMGVPVYVDGRLRAGHVSPVPITFQHYLDRKGAG